jgi:hypothetical protein
MFGQASRIILASEICTGDPDELRRRLRTRIDDLVRCLYGDDATLSNQEWLIASAIGGRGLNCVVKRCGDSAGEWHDHNTNARHQEGDIIDLIAVAKNLNTAGAINWASDWAASHKEHQYQQQSELADEAGEEGRLQVSIGGTKTVPAVQPAGPENLARLESNLRRHQSAMNYLHDRGLTLSTISRFHLGIKEPYTRRTDGRIVAHVLCYPVISSSGESLSRYGCLSIPGVTENPGAEYCWGRGDPTTYYSGPSNGQSAIFVAQDCFDVWILDQYLDCSDSDSSIVFICASHGLSIPSEWKTPSFWSQWRVIYFGQNNNLIGEQAARSLARCCGREAFRARVPEDMGQSWTDFFLSGGTVEHFYNILKKSSSVSDQVPKSSSLHEQLGEFAVRPVNINGAFVNGNLYYPFTVERREVERVERKGMVVAEDVVTSYVTKVLRSDGTVLDIVRLPAPRGTPQSQRVLALTDGTRIEREPHPSHYATWQLESLHEFIRTMQAGQTAPHRPLRELLSHLGEHLRRSVWLPFDEDYTALALYVAMSFVYQIFDAIPLVIVSGDKGTGKSELGDAIAKVSFNSTIIGQGSAAGVVRLLNEARGLVVLDDLESIGRSLEDVSFSDINQMLKLSYKKQTGRKAITDKNGKTTIFDFYGPKVINNTRGVDPILGSRMIRIGTRPMPEAIRQSLRMTISDPSDLANLRNELHVWGMANARKIYEHYTALSGNKRERKDEIAAPLRAIAALSDDETIINSLELALERQGARQTHMDDPIALLKEATYNCVRRGALSRLSNAQLCLELCLITERNLTPSGTKDIPIWRQSEWIGHQLRSLEIRDVQKTVARSRLYGIVTRIYDLRSGYIREVVNDLKAAGASLPDEREPLAFCEQMLCVNCPYNQICDSVMPGLRSAKMQNRGRSGHRAARQTGSDVNYEV